MQSWVAKQNVAAEVAICATSMKVQKYKIWQKQSRVVEIYNGAFRRVLYQSNEYEAAVELAAKTIVKWVGLHAVTAGL